MESGFQVPKPPKKIAYLIEKGGGGQALCDIIARAQEARQALDQWLEDLLLLKGVPFGCLLPRNGFTSSPLSL